MRYEERAFFEEGKRLIEQLKTDIQCQPELNNSIIEIRETLLKMEARLAYLEKMVEAINQRLPKPVDGRTLRWMKS